MKGIVAYDSVHGNTKQVAEAIAEQIVAEGHQAQLVNVAEGENRGVTGDFMFVGSPTRGGRSTKAARNFLENIDREQWRGKTIVMFDTVGPLSKEVERREKWLKTIDEGSKNAACHMSDQCKNQGLTAYPKKLHVPVTGFWGPLADDGPEMAKTFTHLVLADWK